VVLLDIRERFELVHGVAKGALLIPMNSVPQHLDQLPAKDAKLVVYCAHGVRSYGVTGWLRDQGWGDSWSLIGGFSGFMAAGGEAAQPTPEGQP
jgi:rhodanese-related sulfurtransferase